MPAFADVREHPWGYSWSNLRADRQGDTVRIVHDTVVITLYREGWLYCWRCRKMSAVHPCEHVRDVLAFRNRTQGHGDDAADPSATSD